VERQPIGSWLSGPRAAAQQAGVDVGYRGQRLGLPQAGAGSVAGFSRRAGAVMVDWLACLAVSDGLLGGRDGRLTLAVFALMNVLLVGTLGYTLGKRLFGLRVVRLDGRQPAPLPVLIRTALLCLAVPALIWDRDGRGLHDRAAGTVVVRT
jgi:uncharacterized RDD family membrane protein YckC